MSTWNGGLAERRENRDFDRGEYMIGLSDHSKDFHTESHMKTYCMGIACSFAVVVFLTVLTGSWLPMSGKWATGW